MTGEQMEQSLAGVGAQFFLSSTLCVLESDPLGARPSYHIKPATSSGGAYGGESLVRVFSQAQLQDWVQTQEAALRITDEDALEALWEAYHQRWYC